MSPEFNPADKDFIRNKVAADVASGRFGRPVMTRFPPEPNGYLHIGHAKSICLNFGVADEFGGVCNLRFDDTNPETEDARYAEAIQADVRWLGFDWADRLYFASDYFDKLFDVAVTLIRNGKAYVDSLNEAEIRSYRGTVTEPGRDSPYRDRTVEENLDLFHRMRAGEFADGAHVLRARIDMAAPNMLMRDPLLYRIRHAHHYRQGDAWCIYPMYDFAHGLSDAFEGVTHSLCTLEFKDNRELYDWGVIASGVPMRPEQTEFARLELDYTVVSKRKLVQLVRDGHVDGWDDPRMPTLAGMRRRGVPPDAIRRFCDLIGVARVKSRVDIDKLEYCIRDTLNVRVPRVMCVIDPLKVTITNFPSAGVAPLDAPLYPHDVPLEGTRAVPFTRELYIERDDFMQKPAPGFKRLAPGREVRLRYAYYVTCEEVITDPSTGEVVELRCTYDPDTRGGTSPDGRKVSGTLHWVPAAEAHPVEVRLYDRLFTVPEPESGSEDFKTYLNPSAKVVVRGARIEPSVADAPPGTPYQFERLGYFVSDAHDSRPGHLVFNRTVTLRDSWGKSSPGRPVREARGAAHRTERGDGPADRPVRSAAEEAVFSGLVQGHGVSDGDADTLARRPELHTLFEAVRNAVPAPVAATWIVNELVGALRGRNPADTELNADAFVSLVRMVTSERISRTVGKELLAEVLERGGDPETMVAERGLEQVADRDTIGDLVMKTMHAHPDKVEAYRGGRTGMAGFFVGQVLRAGGGTLDPKLVKTLVEEALS